MANSVVKITEGTGTNIDTRTTTTDGDHRQVVVLGDPATDAGVAPVDVVKGVAVFNNETPKFAVIDASSSGDNTIVAAVSGKKIRVVSGILVSGGTVNVRFESGAAGTALTGQMNLVANTGFIIPFVPIGNFETATNTLLNLELSAGVAVDGWITYVEVD